MQEVLATQHLDCHPVPGFDRQALWCPVPGSLENALAVVEAGLESQGWRTTRRRILRGALEIHDTSDWAWCQAGVFFLRLEMEGEAFDVVAPSQRPALFPTAHGGSVFSEPFLPVEPGAFTVLQQGCDGALPKWPAPESRQSASTWEVTYECRRNGRNESQCVAGIQQGQGKYVKQWVYCPASMKFLDPLCAGRSCVRPTKLLQEIIGKNLPTREAVYHNLCPAEDGNLHVRAFAKHLAQLDWHQPGTRLGLDPEHLHSMRIAARRIASGIALFSCGGSSSQSKALRKQVRQVTRTLGSVRDLDVFQARLFAHCEGDAIEDADGLRHLRTLFAERIRAAQEKLNRYLDGGGYRETRQHLQLHCLEEFKEAEPDLKVIDGTIRDLRKKVKQECAALDENAADESLHALRKLIKRLRYFSEYAVQWHGKPARKLARQCQQYQSLLGEHQDAVVSCGLVEGLAKDLAQDPDVGHETYLALGEIIAREGERALQARTQFFAKAGTKLRLRKI